MLAVDFLSNLGTSNLVKHLNQNRMKLIKLSDGEYLVAGKTVSCFTNEEETAVELTDIIPFLLEDKFTKLGAVIKKAPNFESQVVVSQRLVTRQNPASAAGVAQEMVNLLKL